MDLVNIGSIVNSLAILGIMSSNDFAQLISSCMNAPTTSYTSVGSTVTGIVGSMVVSFDLVGFVGSTITNAQSNAFVSVVYKLTNNMNQINVILAQVVSAGVLNIIIKGDSLDTAQKLILADLNNVTSMLSLLKTLDTGLYSPVSSIFLNVSGTFFALKSLADAVTYQMQKARDNIPVGEVAEIISPNLYIFSQRDDCSTVGSGFFKKAYSHSTKVPGTTSCTNNMAVTFSWYTDTILFSTRTVNPNAISSPVATFSLDSTANLTAPIVIILNITRLPTNVSAACAYYDSSINGWNQKGCTLINTSPVDFGFFVTCNCFFQFDNGVTADSGGSARRRRDTDSPHTTTSFAVIAGGTPSTNADINTALSYITYIGIGVSVPLMVFMVLSILLIKKLRTIGRLIIMNMALALSVALSIFVFAVTRTSDAAQCTRFAIVIHYFLLASFFWMAINGYFLWRQFVRVMQAHRAEDNMYIFLLIGWGVPAIGVGICAGLWPQNYGNANTCWLNGDFIWTFLGPVAGILFMNIIFFVMILRVIWNIGTTLSNDIDAVRWIQLRQALNASASFAPAMGVTWVFALLALQPDSTIVFQFLFTICNAFQGLFLFIFHFIMDKKVQVALFRRRTSSISIKSRTRSKNSVTPSTGVSKRNFYNPKLALNTNSVNSMAMPFTDIYATDRGYTLADPLTEEEAFYEVSPSHTAINNDIFNMLQDSKSARKGSFFPAH